MCGSADFVEKLIKAGASGLARGLGVWECTEADQNAFRKWRREEFSELLLTVLIDTSEDGMERLA